MNHTMQHILSRQKALEQFNQFRFQAEISRWWHRFRGQPQTLLSLTAIEAYLPQPDPTPKQAHMVPLTQIVGSLQRAHDYDRQFRPLNNNLRERWIGVNVLNEMVGWDPVELAKVGNLYFVIDGHHRISVARYQQQTAVEAFITNYPLAIQFDINDTTQDALARLQQKSCYRCR